MPTLHEIVTDLWVMAPLGLIVFILTMLLSQEEPPDAPPPPSPK